MNEATVTITGNVATDVRFNRTERGIAVASFRLACTPRRFDRPSGTWIDERTSFVTVTCFRTLAENVVTSLTKGDPVMLTGRLRVQPWEREDKSGLAVDVEALAIGHDLNRGQTRFVRVKRELTADQQGAAAGAESSADGSGVVEEPESPNEAADERLGETNPGAGEGVRPVAA